MSEKTLKARIIQKHDTAANWSQATNFSPKQGELIVYDDLNRIKIGDGITNVNDLKFIDDKPIGGRNLVSNTWITRSFIPNAGSSEAPIYAYNLTEYGKEVLSKIGTELTISFEIKGTVADLGITGRYIRHYNVTGNKFDTICTNTGENNSITTTTEWVKYTSHVYITVANSANCFVIRVPNNDNATNEQIFIRNVKVELGNYATDYSPAPEDNIRPYENIISQYSIEGSTLSSSSELTKLTSYPLTSYGKSIILNNKRLFISYSVDIKNGVNNPNNLSCYISIRVNSEIINKNEIIYLPNDGAYHTYTGNLVLNQGYTVTPDKFQPAIVATNGNTDYVSIKNVKVIFSDDPQKISSNVRYTQSDSAESVYQRVISPSGYASYRPLLIGSASSNNDPPTFNRDNYDFIRGFHNLYVKPSTGTIYANNFVGKFNNINKDDIYLIKGGTELNTTYLQNNLDSTFATFIDSSNISCGANATYDSTLIPFTDGKRVRINFKLNTPYGNIQSATNQIVTINTSNSYPIILQLDSNINFVCDSNGTVDIQENNVSIGSSYIFENIKIEIGEADPVYSLDLLTTIGNYYVHSNNITNLLKNSLPNGLTSGSYYTIKIYQPLNSATYIVQEIKTIPYGVVFQRRYSGTAWSLWYSGNCIELFSGNDFGGDYDLNNLTVAGKYFINYERFSSTLNIPEGAVGALNIEVSKHSAGKLIQQKIIDSCNNIFVRFSIDLGAPWSSWEKQSTNYICDYGNTYENSQSVNKVLVPNNIYNITGNGQFSITLQPKPTLTIEGSGNSTILAPYIASAQYKWQSFVPDSNKWVNSGFTSANQFNFTLSITESRNGNLYRCKITLSDNSIIYTTPVKMVYNTNYTGNQIQFSDINKPIIYKFKLIVGNSNITGDFTDGTNPITVLMPTNNWVWEANTLYDVEIHNDNDGTDLRAYIHSWALPTT